MRDSSGDGAMMCEEQPPYWRYSGDFDVSRRLLRHQHRARGLRQAGNAHGEPRHVFRRSGRKTRWTDRRSSSLAVGMA